MIMGEIIVYYDASVLYRYLIIVYYDASVLYRYLIIVNYVCHILVWSALYQTCCYGSNDISI